MIYAKELLCDVLSDNTYCTCICSVKSMPKEVLMHNIALKVSLHVPCPKDKWRNLERGGWGWDGLVALGIEFVGCAWCGARLVNVLAAEKYLGLATL